MQKSKLSEELYSGLSFVLPSLCRQTMSLFFGSQFEKATKFLNCPLEKEDFLGRLVERRNLIFIGRKKSLRSVYSQICVMFLLFLY